MMDNKLDEQDIKKFYDDVYYKQASHTDVSLSSFNLELADILEVAQGTKILDVACGKSDFLYACKSKGAEVSGVDLSDRAIEVSKSLLPDGQFFQCSAEKLPFSDQAFDIVTCLGSLEHFVNPKVALIEMRRVAKPDAKFLLLVPNKDFLTRKLGLFSGTYQVDAKEVALSLEGWDELFESAGLRVKSRWKDLHVLSRAWIFSAGLFVSPVRALQALLLKFWPLKWQYQVFHLAVNAGDRTDT